MEPVAMVLSKKSAYYMSESKMVSKDRNTHLAADSDRYLVDRSQLLGDDAVTRLVIDIDYTPLGPNLGGNSCGKIVGHFADHEGGLRGAWRGEI